MTRKKLILDKEEESLLKSLETGEWKSSFNSKLKLQYEKYARHSFKKDARINIRMAERDLRKIQIRALQEGIPYQSLITMLIHKYNDGELTVRD